MGKLAVLVGTSQVVLANRLVRVQLLTFLAGHVDILALALETSIIAALSVVETLAVVTSAGVLRSVK